MTPAPTHIYIGPCFPLFIHYCVFFIFIIPLDSIENNEVAVEGLGIGFPIKSDKIWKAEPVNR